MIHRRDFLIGAAGAAAGLMLPRGVSAATERDAVAAAFSSALRHQPWLAGFATASREEFDAPAEVVHGKLPEGLRGTFYRNGPARHEFGGRRYHHWFDGDGLIQAFRFADGGVAHKARFVQTQKLVREREAGRPLVAGFGTSWPDLEPTGDASAGNAANISVVWHADRLLALWEAGEAYGLEPESLATLGPHPWSDETRGLPFSAHPRIEPDGTLWNFGSAPWANALVLYRIQPNGTLGEVSVVPMSEPSYVHDFVATEHYLVFLLPPLHFSSTGDGDSFLSRHHWNGDAPTRWLVIDKADLSRRRWFEAPAGFIFHFGNGWEDGDTLKLDASLYADASIMFGDQRDVMWGKWQGASLPEATTLSLDLASGEVARNDHGLQRDFPSIDSRLTGRRHRHVYSLAQLPNDGQTHPLLNALARQDTETGKTALYRFDDAVIPEEHVFVPKAGASNPASGWLIGTSLETERPATQVQVFDAQQIEDGPIASLRLPYALPLGLHGRFVSG